MTRRFSSPDQAGEVAVERQRDRLVQSRRRNRLVDERLVRAEQRPFLEQRVAVAGQIQDLEIRDRLLQPSSELEAVHARHHQIRQQQIDRRDLVEQIQRFRSVGRHDRHALDERQRPHQKRSNARVVVDDEQARCRRRRAIRAGQALSQRLEPYV